MALLCHTVPLPGQTSSPSDRKEVHDTSQKMQAIESNLGLAEEIIFSLMPAQAPANLPSEVVAKHPKYTPSYSEFPRDSNLKPTSVLLSLISGLRAGYVKKPSLVMSVFNLFCRCLV